MRKNLNEMSVLKVNSCTPLVGNGEKWISADRPRRFSIDDILAPEFGHRCCRWRSLSSESYENRWTAADTEAADPRHHRTIADSTIRRNDNSAHAELEQSADGALDRVSRSSAVTSSRRFHDNSPTSVSSTGCDRGTSPKDAVKIEHGTSATDTEVAEDSNETTGTSCDVTSSIASYPSAAKPNRKLGSKAEHKDCFTLPAWVYCTRYSDRPSAGNQLADYVNNTILVCTEVAQA